MPSPLAPPNPETLFPGMSLNPNAPSSTTGAQGYMQGYDKATAEAMAGGPAAAMARSEAAARGQAASQSDQAIAQAVKAARTGGMMPGQAALAGSAQAAGAYGQGMTQGQEQYNRMLTTGAQLGQSMAERLQAQEQLRSAERQAKMGADVTTRGQNQGLIGSLVGAGAGLLSMLSDRNAKEDIKESRSLSDSLAKLKSYSYRYKGSARPERGVMAQDVEKTEAAPAVIETPAGKAIDTRRLTTINTAAIGEQGRRIRDIEKMLRGFREVK